MPKLINWELIANPYNWIVVTLMVAIFAYAWGMIDPLNVDRTRTQGSPP